MKKLTPNHFNLNWLSTNRGTLQKMSRSKWIKNTKIVIRWDTYFLCHQIPFLSALILLRNCEQVPLTWDNTIHKFLLPLRPPFCCHEYNCHAHPRCSKVNQSLKARLHIAQINNLGGKKLPVMLQCVSRA